MERLVFVSDETTTRGKRLYQMQANGTLLFMAINLNDSFTNSKPGLTVLHQRNSYVNLNDLFNPHNRPGSHPKQVHVALVGKNYMKVSGVTKESGASSTVEL